MSRRNNIFFLQRVFIFTSVVLFQSQRLAVSSDSVWSSAALADCNLGIMDDMGAI